MEPTQITTAAADTLYSSSQEVSQLLDISATNSGSNSHATERTIDDSSTNEDGENELIKKVATNADFTYLMERIYVQNELCNRLRQIELAWNTIAYILIGSAIAISTLHIAEALQIHYLAWYSTILIGSVGLVAIVRSFIRGTNLYSSRGFMYEKSVLSRLLAFAREAGPFLADDGYITVLKWETAKIELSRYGI